MYICTHLFSTMLFGIFSSGPAPQLGGHHIHLATIGGGWIQKMGLHLSLWPQNTWNILEHDNPS